MTASSRFETSAPDAALVTRIAQHVNAYFGTSRTGKVSFGEIGEAVAADEDLAAQLCGLPAGQYELLFDDVQTAVG